MELSEILGHGYLDSDRIQRRIREFGCVVRYCSSKRHPHPQKILGYSSISNMVFVKCTNCHFVYERKATKEERDNYYRTKKKQN